jgi:hypothetical protein
MEEGFDLIHDIILKLGREFVEKGFKTPARNTDR